MTEGTGLVGGTRCVGCGYDDSMGFLLKIKITMGIYGRGEEAFLIE